MMLKHYYYNFVTIILLLSCLNIESFFFKKFKIIKTVIIKFRLTMKDQ